MSSTGQGSRGVKNDSPADHRPSYNELIIEALSNVKEPNGLEIGSIFTYVKQRKEVSKKFKKKLGFKLRKLVLQDKIEMVENCYRIKSYSSSEANESMEEDENESLEEDENESMEEEQNESPEEDENESLEEEPIRLNDSKQPLSAAQKRLNESLEKTAEMAARLVAEAENASFLADEASKEVERIQKMADEQDVLLQVVQDLYERCSLGEVILL